MKAVVGGLLAALLAIGVSNPGSTAQRVPPKPAAASTTATPAVAGLPLVEVLPRPRPGDPASARSFVLLLTGDGGWAGLDQDVARAFSDAGVPVVALDSLKYFWTKRAPAESARAVARTLQHYFSAWRKEKVDLVGYSFGAEVLPFIVPRLPEELRAKIGTLTLISPSASTEFEVRVSNWLPGGKVATGELLQPQLGKLGSLPLLCLYGKGDGEALCPDLPIGVATVVEIGEGHHLGGQAGTIVERIRQFSATAVANQRMSSLRGLPAISVVTSMSTRGSASPPGEAR